MIRFVPCRWFSEAIRTTLSGNISPTRKVADSLKQWQRQVFLMTSFFRRMKCLLYLTKANCFPLLPLFLLLRLLHSLWQRKNPVMVFRLNVRHDQVRGACVSRAFVSGVARSSHVVQIRSAHPYHMGIFRQSQAPTMLSIFRLQSYLLQRYRI